MQASMQVASSDDDGGAVNSCSGHRTTHSAFINLDPSSDCNFHRQKYYGWNLVPGEGGRWQMRFLRGTTRDQRATSDAIRCVIVSGISPFVRSIRASFSPRQLSSRAPTSIVGRQVGHCNQGPLQPARQTVAQLGRPLDVFCQFLDDIRQGRQRLYARVPALFLHGIRQGLVFQVLMLSQPLVELYDLQRIGESG